ncbi:MULTISPECIES: UdgX family uracil-DNA binding protein [unclassified Rhodococcus (in: high G+C Gram-positive bacteria)]|uniref:UdgX family uracil-DNA binding protein n=1 Tax=Rhodococcus sp. SJ-3 TaxID=3454628 RepID=UPI002D86489E|nr:UdgX family uracil-DNA binding protein [Rhodococcus sp. (in: high G+C Gram-positive bacteria)]
MVTYPGAEDYLPDTLDILSLETAARGCRGCDLFKAAEQTVFGDGPTDARLMLVGEQPGNEEDLEGEPFVGPAGRLLDKALVAAGVERDTVYVTNAVKHFRFDRAAGGKRRIHKKPSGGQIIACRPWLVAELDVVRPDVVVCLGVTAARALIDKDFKLTAHRGEVLQLDEQVRGTIDPAVVATIHPSAALRAHVDRDDVFESLVRDLQRAAGFL